MDRALPLLITFLTKIPLSSGFPIVAILSVYVFLSGLFGHWYVELQGPTGQSPVCYERPSTTVSTWLTTALTVAASSSLADLMVPDRLFPRLSALWLCVTHFGIKSMGLRHFNSANHVPVCLWSFYISHFGYFSPIIQMRHLKWRSTKDLLSSW